MLARACTRFWAGMATCKAGLGFPIGQVPAHLQQEREHFEALKLSTLLSGLTAKTGGGQEETQVRLTIAQPERLEG